MLYDEYRGKMKGMSGKETLEQMQDREQGQQEILGTMIKCLEV